MAQEEMKVEPREKPGKVCGKGEFIFAAVGLDHAHIQGMSRKLLEAGAELKWVYDPDPAKVAAFRNAFPQASAARSEAEVLEDETVRLVAAANIPCDRGPLGVRVMNHGKNYFCDKTPFTTLEQLAEARAAAAKARRIWSVYYGERLHSEAGVFAGELVRKGSIGRVVQVMGTGPHRINLPTRPPWFFKRAQYGGILCDIGSHQIEQFLYYAGAKDARVCHSKVANYKFKQYPELEDFGDATLIADNGATNYFRVDWLTPDGLSTWGDGRTFILGTEGYIELRKYVDVGRSPQGDNVFLVTHEKESRANVAGKIGHPFFGQLIRDCLDGTETAMTQEHTFKAAELCLLAQKQAVRVE